MQYTDTHIITVLIATIVLASPFTVKMLLEWNKIRKEYDVNLFENPGNMLSLIFTGLIEKYDIPKDALKSFRISLICHNIIYLPGVAILFYIVMHMKK